MRIDLGSLLLSVVVGGACVGLAAVFYQRDLDLARERWSLGVAAETREVEEHIFDIFHSLYTGLRTIARLPGVRALERHGANLDDNARRTIQEIYNNLATEVTMSEVYLVPIDLEPDAVDPVTGKLQEPTLTFDELIVGRTADSDGVAAAAAEAEEEIEEVEIFEYRAMREQAARLRTLCPTESSVHGLDYPALSSPEVVTCDNRFYSARNPDDAARAGILYSVPVFGEDGALRGMVTGVLLTRVLRECLPNGYHALVNSRHDYVAGSLTPGVWSEHRDAVQQQAAVEGLAWSAVQRLRIVDSDAAWRLWSGRPAVEFTSSEEAAQALVTFAVLAIAGIGIAVGLGLRESSRRRRREEQRQRLVELQRARDTAESLSLARRNLISVASQEIRTPLDGLLTMTDQLLRSELQKEQRSVVETARQSTRMLVDLLQGIVDYAAIEGGELTLEHAEFDLHEQLEHVLELMAPAAAHKGLELLLVLGDDLPERIVGDRGRLRQVVVSLVGNAVKFTNQGTVSVRAEALITAAGRQLCLRVSDTGPGIDPVVRARLFEPFTQGEDQRGGVGLGLASSRALVESMGGSLDLLPASGSGTVLCVSMPLVLPTIRQSAAMPLRGRRIAVGVASERLAAMVADDLVAAGAVVTRCRDAAEVRARLAQTAAPVDLVVWSPTIATSGDDLTEVLPHLGAAGVVLVEGWTRAIPDPALLPAAVREVVRLPLGRRALTAAMLRALEPGHRPASSAVAAVSTPIPMAAPVAVEPAAAAAAAASTPAAAAVTAPPTILVVDPRPATALVLCAMLRRAGLAVVEASDRARALQQVRSRELLGVVVDGLPAAEAARLAHELRSDAANRRAGDLAIAVAGDAAAETELHAAGVAFVRRPVRAATVVAALGLEQDSVRQR